MIFLPHDVVTITGPEALRRRILWVDPADVIVAMVDPGDPTTWPEVVATAEMRSLVESGAWCVEDGEEPIQRLDRELPDLHREMRDRNFDVVRMMVEDHLPGVFFKTTRAARITAAVTAFGLTRPTVTGLLRRYFAGGMTRDALVPLYANCGAPGKARPAAAGAPKRGRPPAPGHPAGINVTEDVRRLFRLAASASFARQRKHDLASAYSFCVRHFLSEEVEDPDTGRTNLVAIEPFRRIGLPTLDQFVYWSRKDLDMVAAAKHREGARVWEMRNKPNLGTSTARVLGPGSRYEIDATVLDVYVRSRGNRRTLVGRPTLYVVIDVFSRMIVGIYVGLEHASWVGAMMALANAVEDKVAFCARFGIQIEPEAWPAHHLCGVLLGDRGELERAGIETVLRVFKMTVETAAPYRADWKGVVESRFRLLQALFAPYVEGYVESDFRKRGGTDYREDAVLDVDDVTRIIIDLVIYFNNHHELKKFDLIPGQVEDGVLSVPAELWAWGIATRSGSGRVPNADRFRFALMPTTQATVTREGIVFEGRHYACETALRDGWYTRAGKQRFKVPISYDKRDVDRIYVHNPRAKLGFDVGTLTDRSRAHAGLTGWESHALTASYAALSARRRDQQTLERAATEGRIDRIGKAARADYEALPAEGSLASQVRGAREARTREMAVDRVAEARGFRPGAEPPMQAEPADVVPIRPEVVPSSARAPTMREIMARKMRQGSGGDEG
jgi:hypothetical protein